MLAEPLFRSVLVTVTLYRGFAAALRSKVHVILLFARTTTCVAVIVSAPFTSWTRVVSDWKRVPARFVILTDTVLFPVFGGIEDTVGAGLLIVKSTRVPDRPSGST